MGYFQLTSKLDIHLTWHPSIAGGRIPFEGQKEQKPSSIPRCLGHKPTHIKKK
jgi:hypothetical protein